MALISRDEVHAFDRVVCLVDGSKDAFASIQQVRTLAPPSARIVAVVPFDLQAATRARCQTGEVALAWEAQADLIRDRAATALEGSWGYTRIVEGSRTSALLKATAEEDGSLVTIPGSGLRRGELRKVLRQTEASILISRTGPAPAQPAAGAGPPPPALLVMVEDELEHLAARLGEGLGSLVYSVPGPRSKAARRIVADSQAGHLVVIRCRDDASRWTGSTEQTVARRSPASVLIVRSAGLDRSGAVPSPATPDSASEPPPAVAATSDD